MQQSKWALLLLVIIELQRKYNEITNYGLRLEASKPTNAVPKAVLSAIKTWFSVANKLYLLTHSQLSDTSSLAQLYWTSTSDRAYSEAVAECLVDLKSQLDEQVTWNQDPKFVEMYNAIFPSNASAPPSEKSQSINGTKQGKHWVCLGFQGSNPCTDFRGSGRLGLLQYYHFCTKYSNARQIMDQSGSAVGLERTSIATNWYPVALISIRLSQGTAQRILKSPIYVSRIVGSPDMVSPHYFMQQLTALHVYLMVEFHAHWQAQVSSGTVKSYLDLESSIKSFETCLDTVLWNGHMLAASHVMQG